MRKLCAIVVAMSWMAAGYSGLGGCSSSNTTPPAENTTQELTVVVTGAGEGSVTADAGDIACRKETGVCLADIETGATVTLTAASDDGYVFLGWYGGECAGAAPCTVTLDQARTVRAAFVLLTYYSTQSFDGSDAVNPGPVHNLFVMKTDGTGLTPLTVSESASSGSTSPKWSPDGEKLVFNAPGMDRIGDIATFNVWVVNGDGDGLENGLINLTQFSTANSSNPQWSPDGTKIAFLSNRRIEGTDALNDNDTINLWIMNADGTDPKPLTQFTADFVDAFNLLWSPQGDKIYFRSRLHLDLTENVTINSTINLWSVRPDGTDLSPVTRLTTDDIAHAIYDISPDGKNLLADANRHVDGGDQASVNNRFNLWMIPTDGSPPTPLTKYTAPNTFVGSPCLSGDGSKAFYTSAGLLDGSDGALPITIRNIWSVNSDGTEPTPLTQLVNAADFQADLDTTADDSRLFFVSDRDFSGDDVPPLTTLNVWSMAEDGSDLQPLTHLTVGGFNNLRGVTVSK